MGRGKQIGSGGFGEVFSLKIKSPDGGKLPSLAIKIPSYDDNAEAEVKAYQIQKDVLGDNAVDFRSLKPKVKDFLGAEPKTCIVMEKLSGDFKTVFSEEGIKELSPEQLKLAETQIPAQLNAIVNKLRAYDQTNPEIVLGDLSPDNIGVTFDKEQNQWKVLVLDSNLDDANGSQSSSATEFVSRFEGEYKPEGNQPLKLAVVRSDDKPPQFRLDSIDLPK